MLVGWTLIALRAAAESRALRRHVELLGGSLLCLPGLRLRPAADPALACADLSRALQAPVCVFTSPSSVRFAARLAPLEEFRGVPMAVGAGTRAALLRLGLDRALAPAPAEQRSEGVLAMLDGLERGATVGLVGAPGGRDLLAPSLRQRGLLVQRADVYRREPARLDQRHRSAAAAVRAPFAILLSSSEALASVRAGLGAALWSRLRRGSAIVASARLADAASADGFGRIVLATSARPSDLLRAAVDHAKATRLR